MTARQAGPSWLLFSTMHAVTRSRSGMADQHILNASLIHACRSSGVSATALAVSNTETTVMATKDFMRAALSQCKRTGEGSRSAIASNIQAVRTMLSAAKAGAIWPAAGKPTRPCRGCYSTAAVGDEPRGRLQYGGVFAKRSDRLFGFDHKVFESCARAIDT